MIYIIVDFFKRCKYFFYINLFINVLILNYFSYKITHKINNRLIQWLYYTINLNGCMLIKIVQWLNTNLELLNLENSKILYDIFSLFYENCNIHDLNYTKKLFLNEFNILLDSDNIIKLDNTFDIKSGSIAQIYKATYNNKEVALKVVHPDINYQLIFPIMYIKFYTFIVNKIVCLNSYRCIFLFDSFFDNLKNQTNMLYEFNNMKYFYDCYKNNKYILIPKPIYATKNILIMEFIDGKKFEELESSSILEKQKIVQLLNLFLKDNYFFKDYYHSDLHESNWKVIKYDDFYKIIIYDYGYISVNKFKESFKKIIYYNDIVDIDSILELLHFHCPNIQICLKEFMFKFKEYIKENNIQYREPFCDEIMVLLYKFIFINKITVEPFMFELFISLILFKKYIIKFINIKKIDVSNANHLISSYMSTIYLCDKYDIFPELKNYFKMKYINNSEIYNSYQFENTFYENLKADNSLDI